MPQLTEAKLRSIKKSGRIERSHDSGGLYLELSAAGGKHWRWKYAFEGKEKRLSFGAWPDVSLKDAREKRDACRKALKEGADPGKAKGSPKTGKRSEGASTFRAVAEEYGKDQMTAHGFRSMASTLLHEAGHDPDVIEAQLAHTGAYKIRAIYNRAQYMAKRRLLMQTWADYLDELRSSAL